MAALDKIFDLLETRPDMVDQPESWNPGGLGEIELEDVLFTYAATAGWRLTGSTCVAAGRQ